MAKKIVIHITSDADWIGVYSNLSEEEYKSFLEDPDEFEDERVFFVEYGYFRSTEVEDEDGNCNELDDDVYDNSFSPMEELEDELDPIRESLCEELSEKISLDYDSFKELAPNSVTIIEKWHTYKNMADYELELEDDEEFDEEKLEFVIDDFFPEWLRHFRWQAWKMKKKGSSALDDIFVEDRLSTCVLVYDGKIIDINDSEDLGADLVVRYAIKTDENGNVISIDRL